MKPLGEARRNAFRAQESVLKPFMVRISAEKLLALQHGLEEAGNGNDPSCMGLMSAAQDVMIDAEVLMLAEKSTGG